MCHFCKIILLIDYYLCQYNYIGMGSHSLLLGIKPRSPTLQVDLLLVEPTGKPKNTGVESLSLLQQIFPTQELNQGLLNCRQILYQLLY